MGLHRASVHLALYSRVRGASTPPAEVKLPHRSRYMNLHTLQWTSPSPPIAGGPSPAESHLEFHT